MSLFKVEELQKATGPHKEADAKQASGLPVMAVIDSASSLRAVIGNVEQGQVIKFVTNGAWSMHELLEYLLARTGPARVYLSTWTITENPARTLHNLKLLGAIEQLHCVLDYRVKERAAKAFQLLSGTADTLKLTKCHAKVTVIENDEWGISIVGSANYSRNPRLEAGTIFTNRFDAVFDRVWLEKAMKDND